MVGHEAVRKNCELELRRRTNKLLVDGANYHSAHEVATSLKRAQRKEISLWPGVVESVEAAWTHAICGATLLPRHP